MFHQTIAIGNVGKDPEMRFTPSGAPCTSFSLAVNRSYIASSGEQVKETVWYRVTCWGKLAEIVKQYTTKGSLVLVIGRLTPDKETGGPRVWTDKSGTSKASFELNADTVRFLSKREAETMAQNSGTEEEDMPF